MQNCIYFVEGECEEALIRALKQKPERIIPGKTKVLNPVTTLIPKSRLLSIKPGTTVVFVFDTDVPLTEKLKRNIANIDKCCTHPRLVFLPQVRNLEEELVRCTDVRQIRELTQSKSNANFKADFCRMTNQRASLTNHQLDVRRLWATNPPEAFAFLPRNGHLIKR